MTRTHLKFLLFFLILANRILGQVEFLISEFRLFPEKITILEIEPTSLSWSIANGFILLDSHRRELVELNTVGDVSLSSGFGKNSSIYGEPIAMGISPEGIWVVDRLENQISLLDYRLNLIRNDRLNLRIFPEYATVDPWGRIFLYSRSYNSIFIVDKGELDSQPFLDLSKEFSEMICIKDMMINQDGEFGILDCEGMVHFFNRLGKRQLSFPSNVNRPEFIAPVRQKWFVFNQNGEGMSVREQEKVSIPGASVPVLDIAVMNRSIAILSHDHILILNVQF